jgi:CPA2 family monovalent cation:H+ antiporter-2
MMIELGITFIQDLAVVLVTAFIIGIIFSRFNQPVVLGYLITGALIGPYALKIVYNIEIVSLLAELGVILLMFSIGLEFNWKKLKRVGAVAAFAGIFGIILMIGIGNAVGRLLGWSYTDSIFLGGVLAVSSTAITIKVLTDLRHLRKSYAQLVLGILIVEDIAAVVLLTIFGSISMLTIFSIQNLLVILFKILLFFIITLTLGLTAIPRGMDWIKENVASQEVLMLTALGLCFALAIFSDYLGFSVALGAFMMGSIISESKYNREIERSTRPIKDMFATVFFVSIGMLLNPFILKDFIGVIIIVSLVTVVGKIFSRSLATYLMGYNGVKAMCVGMGLIQIGEFSFVIAKQGIDMGIISPFVYQVTVGVAILTTMLTPYSIRSAPRIAADIDRLTPLEVKHFFRYFSSWTVSIIKQLQSEGEVAQNFRKKLIDIGVNCLIIILILLTVLGVRSYISMLLPPWLNVEVLSFVLACILSLPSVYIILSRIRGLIDLYIEVLSKRYGLFDRSIIKNTIRNTVFIFLTFFLAINFLPLIMAEWTTYSLINVGTLFIAIGLCAYFFWKTVGKFHDSLDKMIRETILAEDTPTKSYESRRKEVIDIIAEGIKERRIIDQIEITEGSPVIGKTIIDINLRATTGATILSIDRQGQIIGNPKPSEQIRVGDVLVVIGSDEEREKAREMLET